MRIAAFAAITSAALLCTPLLCTPAQAQRYVSPGNTLKLTFFCNITPDCTAAGTPAVRITRPPEHGRVSVLQTRDFCYFRRPNPRAACNRRRVAGVAVHYTAPRGYTGYDSIGVEVISASGVMRTGTYSIQVR
jgi:hypothetical protein